MKFNIEKLILESLDGLWNSRNYGGTSDPPRKDFGPQSLSQGYNFPYNLNAQPNSQIQQPQGEMPVNLAWPLQTCPNTLAEIFVKLLDVGDKISKCLNNNVATSDSQKTKLKKSLKVIVKLLNTIKDLNQFLHNNLELNFDSENSNPEK